MPRTPTIVRYDALQLYRHWTAETDIIKSIRSNICLYTWDWREVTLNKFLNIKDILEHPEIPWNYESVVKRPDFDIDLIKEYPNRRWAWWQLFNMFETETMVILKQNPLLDWNWGEVLKYASQWEQLIAFVPDKWFAGLIDTRPYIPVDIIETYIDKPWDWKKLSHAPYISPYFISKHCDKDWDWERLSHRSDMSLYYVAKHVDKPWDWKYLTSRHDVTCKFIVAHIDKDWNWGKLSHMKKLTWHLVFAYPEKSWWKKALSIRKDLKEEYILRCPGLWNFRALSKNPLVSEEFVKKHWTLPWKGKHSMVKRHGAADVIKRWWLGIYYSPYTKVGKKRLHKEWEKLKEDTDIGA